MTGLICLGRDDEMKKETVFTNVNIRNLSRPLVRRLKSVLALRGQTLTEWFTLVAAETAGEMKASRGNER